MQHGIGRRRERGKKRDDEQTPIYMYKRGERLEKVSGASVDARRGYPLFAPPLAVRPGWTDARFCFLTSFACRSSSGSRPALDEGSVRLRVTVTIEPDRDGGDSTTGDSLSASNGGDLSAADEARVSATIAPDRAVEILMEAYLPIAP